LELKKNFATKEQNTRLGVFCPILRDIIENVRTAIKAHDGYLYIPDLRAYMILDIEHC